MSRETLANLRDYLIGTLSKEDMAWLTLELAGHSREEEELKPYTKEELNARIALAEQQLANGEYYTSEEVFAELMEEKELELAEAV